MIRPTTRLATFGTAILAALMLFAPANAGAQDYFVPKAPARPAPPRPAARPPVQRPAPVPQFAPPQAPSAGPSAEIDTPPIQFPVPPVPALPPLAKGTPPPLATMGVIDVPEVMRNSTAAQQIDRVIGDRREKVSQDAQKEQAAWRSMQQELGNQRTTMSNDQIRAKERQLQERITSAQRQFRERNIIIQESAQIALNQIQAVLIGVIRQVAESRGMNLVLHRQQVALNVNEFDITKQVADELNRILPTVQIPPDGEVPTAQLPVQLAPAATVPSPAKPAMAPAPAKK
jgi:Skp family chaperone for outer membrane proteins